MDRPVLATETAPAGRVRNLRVGTGCRFGYKRTIIHDPGRLPMRSILLTSFRLLASAGLVAAFAAPAAAQCGDVNGSGSVTTSDALGVLRVAVGQAVELVCDGECAEVEPRVTELESQLADAMTAIGDLQALLAGVTRSGNAIVVSGANLQVVDGSGTTTGPTNGLGNLIIGYNEADEDRDQSGSHNLVIGMQHEFTSFGGIVAGENNTIVSKSASVLGGKDNISAEDYATIAGGSLNLADGLFATIGGGFDNQASGLNSAVSGGCENMATNTYAAVSGGRLGVASGEWSSVSGGYTNKATSTYTSVSGGSTRTASAIYNWKAGSLSEAN
jgi:hypothetical protein